MSQALPGSAACASCLAHALTFVIADEAVFTFTPACLSLLACEKKSLLAAVFNSARDASMSHKAPADRARKNLLTSYSYARS
jgi:hypothetical protein